MHPSQRAIPDFKVTDYRDPEKRVRFSQEKRRSRQSQISQEKILQRITEEDVEFTSIETNNMKKSEIIITSAQFHKKNMERKQSYERLKNSFQQQSKAKQQENNRLKQDLNRTKDNSLAQRYQQAMKRISTRAGSNGSRGSKEPSKKENLNPLRFRSIECNDINDLNQPKSEAFNSVESSRQKINEKYKLSQKQEKLSTQHTHRRSAPIRSPNEPLRRSVDSITTLPPKALHFDRNNDQHFKNVRSSLDQQKDVLKKNQKQTLRQMMENDSEQLFSIGGAFNEQQKYKSHAAQRLSDRQSSKQDGNQYDRQSSRNEVRPFDKLSQNNEGDSYDRHSLTRDGNNFDKNSQSKIHDAYDKHSQKQEKTHHARNSHRLYPQPNQSLEILDSDYKRSSQNIDASNPQNRTHYSKQIQHTQSLIEIAKQRRHLLENPYDMNLQREVQYNSIAKDQHDTQPSCKTNKTNANSKYLEANVVSNFQANPMSKFELNQYPTSVLNKSALDVRSNSHGNLSYTKRDTHNMSILNQLESMPSQRKSQQFSQDQIQNCQQQNPHSFKEVIRKVQLAQKELQNSNIFSQDDKSVEQSILIDIDKYVCHQEEMSKDKLLGEISAQNTWFAKNIIHQMKELNRYKSQEKDNKDRSSSISNMDVLKQQRDQSEKAMNNYESICQVQKLKMENFQGQQLIEKKSEEIGKLLLEKEKVSKQMAQMAEMKEKYEAEIKQVRSFSDSNLRTLNNLTGTEERDDGDQLLQLVDWVQKSKSQQKKYQDQIGDLEQQIKRLNKDEHETQKQLVSKIKELSEQKDKAQKQLSEYKKSQETKNFEMNEELLKICELHSKMQEAKKNKDQIQEQKRMFNQNNYELNAMQTLVQKFSEDKQSLAEVKKQYEITQNQLRKEELMNHSLRQVIVFQDKLTQGFIDQNQQTILQKIEGQIDNLVDSKHGKFDKEHLEESMTQTVSKLLEFQSLAEKTFEKNLFNSSMVSLDFNQTSTHQQLSKNKKQCTCQGEEYAEYTKQGYQDILEDQIRQIGILKIENVSLQETLKTEQESSKNLTEKVKKLEKFYSKLKGKKYRNCAIQTDNDENIEDYVSKKRQDICKSALVNRSNESIDVEENKNVVFQMGDNGNNINENFSKILMGQSISEERKSLASKKMLKNQIQLKIQQFQQAVSIQNDSKITSNVTTTRRGLNLDPVIVQEHIFDQLFDGNKMQYQALNNRKMEPNMESAIPSSEEENSIQDIDYNEIILREIGNITEQSQITRNHNTDANIDDKSQNKSILQEIDQFNGSKYYEESRQLEDSLNQN